MIRGAADRVAPAGATPPAPPPPVAPAGWTIGPLGSPGSGSVVLYWWPDEPRRTGIELGRVSRPVSRRPFTHVVTYRRPTTAFTGTVDTLLDSASYGHRWVLLHGHQGRGKYWLKFGNRVSCSTSLHLHVQL